MIVVQRIETVWTKNSRGMPNAAKRNRVPKYLELPIESTSPGSIFVHEAVADENDNFILSQKTSVIERGMTYREFNFVKCGEKIEVQFSYSYNDHGKPNRGGGFRRKIFELDKGEFGTLHINGRYAAYSGQWYVQHCVNIGNFDKIEKDIFTASEPGAFVNKLVRLF